MLGECPEHTEGLHDYVQEKAQLKSKLRASSNHQSYE